MALLHRGAQRGPRMAVTAQSLLIGKTGVRLPQLRPALVSGELHRHHRFGAFGSGGETRKCNQPVLLQP
jgi:hypothetical protein